MTSQFIVELEKEFGKDIGLHSCMAFENDFRYFLDKIKPKIFVDIGTFKGLSAGFVAKYYADVVYTFDIDRGEGFVGHGVSRKCDQKELEIRYQVWDHLRVKDKIRGFELDPRIQFLGKQAILSQIDFDMALIDGAHEYESVKEDFGLVKRCGAVLFDDFFWAQGNGARKFIEELAAQEGQTEIGKRFVLWRLGNAVKL